MRGLAIVLIPFLILVLVIDGCGGGAEVETPATPTLTPAIEEYSNSGCLAGSAVNSRGDQYPWCGQDEIEVSVENDNINVLHRNATYNCCPDDIQVSLSAEGNVVKMTEKEVLTTPCRCLCCYEIESTVVNLSAGIYEIEYCWDDYEAGGSQCSKQRITVP